VRACLCLGLLFIPVTVHAEQVSVRTAWGELKNGELVEGVRGDYLLLRYPSQREEMIGWSSIHSVARAGYPFETKNKLDLPWAARPTIGVTAGLGGVGAARFGPYLGSGVSLGASAGVSITRFASFVMVYEYVSHPPDVRNAQAPSGRSHFVGVAARVRLNDASGTAGFFFQPTLGLRHTAYSFSPTDGTDFDQFGFAELPRGKMTERASLLGWEARVAFGLAFSMTRTLSVDVYLLPGIGSFFNYTDTLGCSTFRFGACGGGYKFGYTSLSFLIGVTWN
jgi:hypothetical protein